jgi:hypothetical protein
MSMNTPIAPRTAPFSSDHVELHVQDFDAVSRRVLHRQLVGRDLDAVLEDFEGRTLVFGSGQRRVLRWADAELLGERPVDPNPPALPVFGDADSDRQSIEHRVELA